MRRDESDHTMKVLLIGTMYPPYFVGGAEKAMSTLAEALGRRGHNVVVVTLHPGTVERVEEQDGIRIYRLPMDNVYWPFARRAKPNQLLRLVWHLREIWNWKAATRVGKILDAESPDVVHTHNIGGFSVAIWRTVKLRKIRLVHTMHDYYLLCSRSTLYRRGGSCESRCIDCQLLTANRRAASRLPDQVVAVSQFMLDRHKQLGFSRRNASRVVYNIQSTSGTEPKGTRTNTNAGVLSFGYIGGIEPKKGIEIVLEATRRLMRSGWRLRIAGSGRDAYVTFLRQKYNDEKIEWLGFTTAAEFYPTVDVMVIPSQWNEPMGYACVESLHEGRALICARVGGLPEIAQLSNLVEYFQPERG
jgi:glycosyltransferase involved in cell wall biosynthesis